MIIDAEVWVDDDAVVVLCAGKGDKAAVDFFCYDGRRAREGGAEAAAAPGDPFKDVAWYC